MKRPGRQRLPCGARSYASLLFAIILLAVGNLHQIRRTAARGIKGAPKIGAQKPNVIITTPKLSSWKMNIMVQPVTSMWPVNLDTSASIAQITDPTTDKNPRPVTIVMGRVEKLKSVSATSRIFFLSVQRLFPIFRSRRI